MDDMYKYLGIIILSNVIHLSNIQSYWSNIGVDAIKESISVNRYETVYSLQR